jgi:hypothetical protein
MTSYDASTLRRRSEAAGAAGDPPTRYGLTV